MLRAGEQDSKESHFAIQYLCEKYWYPTYLFVLKRTGNEHDAQDITQSFFSELIEKNKFSFADRSKGKFRTFLLTSVDNFLKNDWRKRSAQKRGGNANTFSLDFGSVNDAADFRQIQDEQLTAEQLFERRWAIELLRDALEQLKEDFASQDRARLFELLKPTLTPGASCKPYSEISEIVGMSESNIKVAVHRLRDKFRQKVRLLVADTVGDPNEIDEEISNLFAAFSNS